MIRARDPGCSKTNNKSIQPSRRRIVGKATHPPDERGCGIIIGGRIRRVWKRAARARSRRQIMDDRVQPGDNAEAAARRLLREKFGKHHAFNQPIHYPSRSYH